MTIVASWQVVWVVAGAVYGGALLGWALWLVWRWIWQTDDRIELFVRYHASAPSRTADAVYWFFKHFYGVLDNGRGTPPYKTHRDRAWGAFGVGILLATGPALVAIYGDQGDFDQHAIAAALGALIWGTVVELAGSPTRGTRYAQTARQPRDEINDFGATMMVLVGDMALVAVGLSHVAGHDTLGVLVAGAAVVAFVDAVAVVVTLAVAQMQGSPFR